MKRNEMQQAHWLVGRVIPEQTVYKVRANNIKLYSRKKDRRILMDSW